MNGRYANVTATMALVMALSGVGYAVVALPTNSVGSAQIKAKAVKTSDLGRGAVTTRKVRDGSLLRQDFAAGQLVAGPTGPTGATGPAGPTGAQGLPGDAVAFARVNAAGTLDAGTPSQQKNVVQANVQHDVVTGAGVYCFGGLSFTPRSALVTIDSAGAISTSNQIASVAVQRGNALANCDATHQQARVSVIHVDQTNAPTLTDHGFVIWFED
jgi:hypothetical protein